MREEVCGDLSDENTRNLDDFVQPDDDGDETGVTVEEAGNVVALEEYSNFGIDRDPRRLDVFIKDLKAGVDLGHGWRAIKVQNKRKHGIPGRLLPTRYASLAQLTREARTVAVAGRCDDVDFPNSHFTSLVAILDTLGVLVHYKMIQRYSKYYREWRVMFSKMSLNRILYGGVPDGNDWNPVTWTLASEIRTAGAYILDNDAYAYLNDMFGDRKNPFYSRLYYALSSHEDTRLGRAHAAFEASGFKVRSLIYDGFLTEGMNGALLQEHGLLCKDLVRWQDHFFMVLRRNSENTHKVVEKVIGCKNVCIWNSLLNVGSNVIKRAVPRLAGQGPFSYAKVQMKLVASKTRQYIAQSTFQEMQASLPGSSFLVHCSGHAVGIVRKPGCLYAIADDSYAEWSECSSDAFAKVYSDFEGASGHHPVTVFKLYSGNFVPGPFHESFYLVAGAAKGVKGVYMKAFPDKQRGKFRLYSRPQKLPRTKFSALWKKTPYVRNNPGKNVEQPGLPRCLVSRK